jgi:lipoyl(octanoyl) transferase
MIIKQLGLVDYPSTCQAMQTFTAERDSSTEDELWVLEHNPVFTQGLNGDPAHILNAGDIPIIDTDRGGQVTYHGPGQLVVYTLIDLRRNTIGVREMVTKIEQSVIAFLSQHGVTSESQKEAPGVYVDGRKIASLGLRVKRGACYHGVSININMDLTPFSRINPCGFASMEVIDLSSLNIELSMEQAQQQFVSALMAQLQQGKT